MKYRTRRSPRRAEYADANNVSNSTHRLTAAFTVTRAARPPHCRFGETAGLVWSETTAHTLALSDEAGDAPLRAAPLDDETGPWYRAVRHVPEWDVHPLV